ncbi:MAG: CvpA family protein [Gammaproteobacteria bacterium]|nr:CvpA family protein [Gammaproteobacteria bacterium]MYD80006.1 CvpA family protein [Gammaproteobacteria bacterium]
MEALTFSALDIGLLVVILVSSLFGWRNGFLSELISLTSWVVGVICAIILGKQLGDWMFSSIALDKAWIPQAVGSTIILIVVLVVGAFVQSLVKESLVRIGLEGVDKGLGFLFGILRGCFILIAVGIIFNLKSTNNEILKDSFLLTHLMQFEHIVRDIWELFVSWISTSPPQEK